MKTITKSNSTNIKLQVSQFAEAWREKAAAEERLKEAKDVMLAFLKETGDFAYTYADGVTVDFKKIEGHTPAPVTLDEAQKITGFGEARLRKIAGNVDAKKVDALLKLGELTPEQAQSLVPKTPYDQIRGFPRKS